MREEYEDISEILSIRICEGVTVKVRGGGCTDLGEGFGSGDIFLYDGFGVSYVGLGVLYRESLPQCGLKGGTEGVLSIVALSVITLGVRTLLERDGGRLVSPFFLFICFMSCNKSKLAITNSITAKTLSPNDQFA